MLRRKQARLRCPHLGRIRRYIWMIPKCARSCSAGGCDHMRYFARVQVCDLQMKPIAQPFNSAVLVPVKVK
jgi:hypothetical protein